MRKFLKILLNQLRNSAFEFITDVLLSSVAEHRRAKRNGDLDLNKQNANYQENFQGGENSYQNSTQNNQNFHGGESTPGQGGGKSIVDFLNKFK